MKKILYLLLFTAWISISLSSIIVLLSGATALQAAFWRLFFSVLLLVTYHLSREKKRVPSFNRYTSIAGVLLGLHFLVWMKSLFLIPVSLSTTLVVMYPAITAVLDYFVLKEKILKKQIIGLITAFLGVIILLRPNTDISAHYLYGSILALAGAFFAAGYFFIGRITRLEGWSLTEYVIPTYTVATITLLVIGAPSEKILDNFNVTTWIYLFLLALIPMIGGHTIMNYLLKHMKTYGVTSIALGEPIGASILAYIILKQKPTHELLLGMTIVLIGLYLVMKNIDQGESS